MRLLIVTLAIVLVLLQLRLWVSDDGLREVWRLTDQVERQTLVNRRLAERNAALEAQVGDLKQGLAAAEELARSELGMLREGETFYQIVPFAHPPLTQPHAMSPAVPAEDFGSPPGSETD